MKFKVPLLVALSLCVYAAVNAQKPVPRTDVILDNAYKQAKLENKRVFVIFHASWCVWCHKMDSSMNDVSCKKMFQDNYVTCHLTVDESKDKKDLETPDADAFRAKYHGETAGLPFWLIFDNTGKLLADSRMRKTDDGPDALGDNMGCPASTDEVAHFIKILSATSKLSDQQLRVIQERFSKNK